ncbi:glutamine synthetase, partial [Pseudomonas sp. HMWF006]
MRNALKYSVFSLVLLMVGNAWAQVPALASCTRSANLLACVDADGNAYSVNTVG